MNHSSNNTLRNRLQGILTGVLATSLLPALAAESDAKVFSDVLYTSDYQWFWAVEAIDRWSDYNVLHGYDDNTFRPGNSLTRAQFAVILDAVMDYRVEYTNYLNYEPGWYDEAIDGTSYIRKAYAAGILAGYTDGTIRPDGTITRVEAAAMICSAFNISYNDNLLYTTFADNSEFKWGKGQAQALYDLGIVTGKTGNTFAPNAAVTRAEIVVMLDQCVELFVQTPQTIDSAAVNGTMVVNTEDVTIKNTTVYTGNMILSEGISDGSIYLENVVIDGDLVVKGGGVHSIYLDNVAISGELYVNRMEDDVRIVILGKTTLPEITIESNCIIEAGAADADSVLGDITIQGAVSLVDIEGNFNRVTNKVTGLELYLMGNYAEGAYLNAQTILNNTAYPAGTVLTNEEIPTVVVDFLLPNIELVADYGSAVDESPSATLTVDSAELDSESGIVTVSIYVEDVENCLMMAENANAVSVYNPDNSSALGRLELNTFSKHGTNYSLYTVSFQLTNRNFDTVTLAVNFKAEDDYAMPNVTRNYNGIESAYANVTIDSDVYFGATLATAYIDVTGIRNCEIHYLEEYAFTTDQDVDLEVVKIDSGDDYASYKITYKFAEIDNLNLIANFLKEGAQDSVPDISARLAYVDPDDEEEEVQTHETAFGSVKVGEEILNAQGLMEVQITVDPLDAFVVKSSLIEAVTINADRSDYEGGYGQTFDVTAEHSGRDVIYTITFEPNGRAEDIQFLIHIVEADEDIPAMSITSNLERINAGNISDYVEINRNTITVSNSKVSMEVLVHDLSDLVGYSLDSTVFTLLNSEGEEDTESETGTKFTVTKKEDNLYAVSYNIVRSEADNEESAPMDIEFRMNLKLTSNYVNLVPVGSFGSLASNSHSVDGSVPASNLPYSVKSSVALATDTDNTEDYNRKITFTVVPNTGALTASDVAVHYYEVEDEEGDPVFKADAEYTVVCGSVSTSGNQEITIYFSPNGTLNPEDVTFYVRNISTTGYTYSQTLFSSAVNTDWTNQNSVYNSTDDTSVFTFGTPTATVNTTNGNHTVSMTYNILDANFAYNDMTATVSNGTDSYPVTATRTGTNSGTISFTTTVANVTSADVVVDLTYTAPVIPEEPETEEDFGDSTLDVTEVTAKTSNNETLTRSASAISLGNNQYSLDVYIPTTYTNVTGFTDQFDVADFTVENASGVVVGRTDEVSRTTTISSGKRQYKVYFTMTDSSATSAVIVVGVPEVITHNLTSVTAAANSLGTVTTAAPTKDTSTSHKYTVDVTLPTGTEFATESTLTENFTVTNATVDSAVLKSGTTSTYTVTFTMTSSTSSTSTSVAVANLLYSAPEISALSVGEATMIGDYTLTANEGTDTVTFERDSSSPVIWQYESTNDSSEYEYKVLADFVANKDSAETKTLYYKDGADWTALTTSSNLAFDLDSTVTAGETLEISYNATGENPLEVTFEMDTLAVAVAGTGFGGTSGDIFLLTQAAYDVTSGSNRWNAVLTAVKKSSFTKFYFDKSEVATLVGTMGINEGETLIIGEAPEFETPNSDNRFTFNAVASGSEVANGPKLVYGGEIYQYRGESASARVNGFGESYSTYGFSYATSYVLSKEEANGTWTEDVVLST